MKVKTEVSEGENMNKVKKIIFPVVFVIISLLIIGTGFVYFGFLGNISLPAVGKPDGDLSEVRNNSDVIEEIIQLKTDNSAHKKLSVDMSGLWIETSEDFGVTADKGTDAVKYAVYSDINYYKNFLPDTLFIKPDTKNVYSALTEADGSSFDILSYSLYYADQLSLDKVLIADEDIVLTDDGTFTTERISSYLSSYSFDAVLFSCESLFGKSELCEYTEMLSKFLDEKFSSVLLGVEVNSDTEALFADKTVISIFEKKLCDFGYVDMGYVTSDASYPFGSVALWWNSFAEYYNVPFYCEHRTDKVFVNSGAWSDGTEISKQMEQLYVCPYIKGSVFYNISCIKNKKSLATDLSIFINDVAGTVQETINVQSLMIDTANNVNFTGLVTVDENVRVFCSDKEILTENKSFSVSYPLERGRNVFDFRGGGARYNYIIDNPCELIYVNMSEIDYVTGSDSDFSPSVFCPSGAEVYLIICGKSYEMSESTSVCPEGIPADYSSFTCSVSSSELNGNADEFTVLCFFNGEYSRFDYGNGNSDNGYVKLSPYNDNGLGRSLMCMTDCDNTEQISKPDDYDTYHPDRSALLKGTVDYVDKISVSEEGYLVYELKSGINVYGVDSILINNGYNMPMNNVVLEAFDDSSDKHTKFSFRTDWLSPITVSPQPQDYKVGHMEFSYNISEFNAEYFDLTFYYTETLDVGSLISFASNSVFSSYDIFSDNNGNLILRLYLSKPGCFYGFDLNEVSDGLVEVTFRKRLDNSIAGKVIMVDAGHGGISMIGTALKNNTIGEYQVTLDIARYVKSYLEQMGASVIMTRTDDVSMLLSERTYMSETMNPDVFISIHCDGSDFLYESGTHTFYYTPFSQPLASSIHNSLVNTYRNEIYVEGDENYERIDRKIKYYPFYVTRIDNCPSVLIETGFMTNYVEGNVLVNPVNQDKLAKAIARGLSDYFVNSY